jgi:PAS domain S-box-containing protein
MTTELKALIVEDKEADAKLLIRALKKGGFEPVVERVDTPEAMRDALERVQWDVVLSDWAMPRFDAPSAFALLHERRLDIPFIIVSGTVGEDTAVEALKAGANDFLIKSKLSRLVPAIERELRESANRRERRQAQLLLSAVFANARDAMLISDNNMRYVDGNPAAMVLLGADRERLLGMGMADMSPRPLPEVEQSFREFVRMGKAFGETEIIGAGGRRVLVEYAAAANIIPGRHLSVLRDITERRRVEGAIRRLAAIVESTDDAIIASDLEGKITDWNPGAERLFEYTAQEMLGRSIALLSPPALRADVDGMLERIKQGDHVRNAEAKRLTRSGNVIEVAITISPLKDAAGQVVGVSKIARDITEARRMQQRLSIADRMASIGTLAAGVAHEVNNPLAYVKTNVDFAVASAAELPPAIAEALTQAQEGIERIRVTVRDLKTFTRGEEETRKLVDVNRVLESSLSMAGNEIKHRARLLRELDTVGPVLMNEAKLGQVFLNLLVNAAHAIGDGMSADNTITVRTSDDGEQVTVAITDTGRGIAAADLPHIFEPFFTTKPVGEGTGLGLALCHSVITAAGGELRVTSTVAKGTTVRVILPRSKATAVGPPKPAAVTEAERRARILVIDDEPMLIRALVRILGAVHEVTGKTDARAALALIESGERYDVILCDLMMPGMSGMAFYERLQEVAPEMARRVVFASGGAFTPKAQVFFETCTNPRIDKPLDPVALRELIRTMTSS